MNLDKLDQAIAQARQGEYAQLAQIVYEVNKANGYWDAPRDSIECCVLANTELNEAIEAWRKNRYCGQLGADLFKESTQSGYKKEYEYWCKDTFEAEIAGTAIRCLDWMGYARIYETDGGLYNFVGNVLHDISQLQEFLLSERRSEFWASYFIPLLLQYTTFKGFDLWQFVQWEVKYNAVRGGMKAEGKQA